jgi:hypothetical protein
MKKKNPIPPINLLSFKRVYQIIYDFSLSNLECYTISKKYFNKKCMNCPVGTDNKKYTFPGKEVWCKGTDPKRKIISWLKHYKIRYMLEIFNGK